jgi:starvation-inducible DNA-binding protein
MHEAKGGGIPAREMLSQLLADHETLIRTPAHRGRTGRGEHADAGTEDFLIGLMEQHERMAWMLRSYLA